MLCYAMSGYDEIGSDDDDDDDDDDDADSDDGGDDDDGEYAYVVRNCFGGANQQIDAKPFWWNELEKSVRNHFGGTSWTNRCEPVFEV